jgi:hypothetical protein
MIAAMKRRLTYELISKIDKFLHLAGKAGNAGKDILEWDYTD